MGLKDNTVLFLFRNTWKFSKGNRRNLILLIILFFFSNISWLMEPLIIGYIFNVIQLQGITNENYLRIIALLGSLLLLEVSFWLFHGPARYLEEKNAFIVRANYKKYLLEGTMDLPISWHTNHHSGDTIDKIEKATSALFDFSGYINSILRLVIMFIGAYIALIIFNVHSSYLVLVFAGLTIWVVIKFDNRLREQYKELNKLENKIAEKIYDSISNITTIIILRVEKLILNMVVRKIMKPFKLFRKNRKMEETKWFLVSFLTSLMIFFVLGSYIYFNLKGGEIILIGTLFLLYDYLSKIKDRMFNFASMYSRMVYFKAKVENVEDVSKLFAKDSKNKDKLPRSWKELVLKDLHFSYHKGKNKELHIDNVSMTIKKGERIAFVGESGSGKTTLLKIIRDLYHPKNVNISVDGKDIKRDFEGISDSIALIPQDPEIFNTTIKENITLGVRYDLFEIKKYAKMAQFTEVIRKLPKKMNSSIVEKGVNLSGGEKQRLALARGLMACKDKDIILLDEPTSSVDMKNELQIYQNIFKEFKGKTIISSIHRLHLLRLFDTIYLFRNGKIVNSGNFNYLLRESKEFKQLWKKYKEIEKE